MELNMKNIALYFALILTSVFGMMIIGSFITLGFYWGDLVIYSTVGLIVYVIIMVVGSALDKKFNNSMQTFFDGKEERLFDDNNLLRSFALLLITLLPYLLYLHALALFAAIDFAGYTLVYFGSERIPVVLLVGLAIVVIGTGLAILIGFYFMFFPPKRKTIGIVLNEREQQHLWAVSMEIAEEMKTKPINKMIVTQNPGICVYLEGNTFLTLLGRGKKVLEIGLPSLHNMNTREFKAILSHEYGHFSHRDTQWSVFTYSMGTSLINTLRSMPGPKRGSEWGLIRLIMAINPAYWIFLIYTMLYFKITNGFSRIREVMADIVAMNLYGGKSFASALMKVAVNDTFIQPVWHSSLIESNLAISHFSKAMDNFYADHTTNEDIEELKKRILSRSQTHSIYDSHPALKTRIDYAMKYKDKEINISQQDESFNTSVDFDKIFNNATPDELPISKLFNDWDLINTKIAELFNMSLTHTKSALPK
jgi:Zn-dependent protease with chaperone function